MPAAADGVLFRKSPTGYRPPDGMLVKILQAALKKAGHYTSEIDGSYGAATESAVKRAQAGRGAVADGVCRNSDWEAITGLPAPSLFDRCLTLTAAFEGTGFEKAVGNFDGAYLTWGIIGYTLKHDLPQFLDAVEREYPGTLARAFGAKESELRQVLKASASDRERWGNSVSVGANRYDVHPEWKAAFARLGAIPEVQSLQVKDARERYWNICLRDCRRWRAADAIDVALFFDTAVQNGGAGRPSIAEPLDQLLRDEPSLSGLARRRRWAQIISEGSNPPARQDVLIRRSTIATGDGKVHGDNFRVADWGLEPSPVDLAALAEAHATFMPASLRDDQPTAPTPAPTPAAPPIAQPAPTPAPAPMPQPAPTPSPAPPVVVVPATPAAPLSAETVDFSRDFKALIAIAMMKIDRPGLDRNWGEPAPIAVAVLLEKRQAELPATWRSWDDKRMSVALVQLVAKSCSIDPGVIDGLWGQLTQYAFDSLVHLRDTGSPLSNWRDDEPIDVNPNGWPNQSEAALAAYYGRACQVRQVKVRCPWTLRLAWDQSTTLNEISCHEKVAESLARVLEAVHRHYGEAEIRRLRLDQFGGCYNCRQMRGSNRMSTHAWAIAIDWDPDNNQLTWGRDRATLAKPVYRDWWAIWEREGWLSLGRVKNYDWMHVQAAKL
ncbi:MAG TPA: peptidoglycan-binding domain-containing protein [Hyphomicrobiaceae bacterium]|nr:peptidoglycan-binding domain-containing protein [Hyphomicrobiaceae bacterium]